MSNVKNYFLIEQTDNTTFVKYQMSKNDFSWTDRKHNFHQTSNVNRLDGQKTELLSKNDFSSWTKGN